MIRDFTYIDDLIQAMILLIKKLPKGNNLSESKGYNASDSWAPYKIFNIGNSKPENLSNYIAAIEKYLNRKAKINLVEMQPGDVEATYAYNESLENWIGYKPTTTIDEGIKNFIDQTSKKS